jgi:hypothetical protein
VPARRRLQGGLGVLRKIFAGSAPMSRKSNRTPAKRRSYLP